MTNLDSIFKSRDPLPSRLPHNIEQSSLQDFHGAGGSVVKNLSEMKETGVQSLAWEDLLEE